jgi:hypothetical protein
VKMSHSNGRSFRETFWMGWCCTRCSDTGVGLHSPRKHWCGRHTRSVTSILNKTRVNIQCDCWMRVGNLTAYMPEDKS